MQTREQRFSAGHLRSESAGAKTYISGYTAKFNSLSCDLGGFREMLAPSAFDRSLASDPDVVCLFNHEQSQLLGRTKNKTLSLSTDRIGLFFRCEVPTGVRAGQDIVNYLKRGDVDGCSFAFACRRDLWTRGKDPETGEPIDIRTVLDAELFDCGPVVTPAYSSTTVAIDAAARMAALPASAPMEVRSRFQAPKPLSAEEIALRVHARSRAERLLPDGLAADYERERLQRRMAAVREEFGF